MGAMYHRGRSQIVSTSESHGGDLILQMYDWSDWRVGLLQCLHSLKGARQVRGQGRAWKDGGRLCDRRFQAWKDGNRFGDRRLQVWKGGGFFSPRCGKGGGSFSPRRLAVSRARDAMDASGQIRHSASHTAPLFQQDAPPLASSQRPPLVATQRNAHLQQPLVPSQREGLLLFSKALQHPETTIVY
ncbi:hypothetical protein GW17_00039699 [Ensete ventricosum]|nr:hypothetical protein GW17_00039699 [Ensete ventricosum]